jgi:outer membrane protein
MNKNVVTVLAALNVVLLCVVGYLAFNKNSGKIYYVDSAKLLKEYKEMGAARKEFESQTATWKANVDTLTSGVQKQIEAYEKESSKMSEKERSLSRELIGTRQRELMDYQRALESQAGEQERKIMGTVLNNVNIFLTEYGKEKGCTYILLAANGNIAYGEESLNITEEVIKKLNERYASGADSEEPAASEKTAPADSAKK